MFYLSSVSYTHLVGPEHSYFKDTNRVQYTSVNDQQALAAFQLLSRTEGIIPAMESSHAPVSYTHLELDSLPGVGPSTAAAILEYRKQIGSFQSIEEVKKVR